MLRFFEKVKRPLNPASNSASSSNDPSVNVLSVGNVGGGENNGGDDSANKRIRVESGEINDEDIVGDPTRRKPIEKYDARTRDEVRRCYILKGPCQPILERYPMTMFGTKNRQFQKNWFKTYPWLEYSESTDAVYCFYCYLFKWEKALTTCGGEVYTKKGFRNWKKATVKFKEHAGASSSVHSYCETQYFSLKNQRYSERCPEIANVVLKNAPGNNQLSSPCIQKDIVSACAAKTTSFIINEIGEQFFSILIDGTKDSSVKEQITFVLRYVNNLGEIVERFVGITHVSDTSAQSLKYAVDNFLTNHGLALSKVRGQGYDGTSNMRSELNELKALILNENNSAWYVHCFAHQLQLIVVSVAEEIHAVSQFFDYVYMIVNMVGASCKRKDALRQKQHDEIVQKLDSGEISNRTGLHQETSLARLGETRWGSHYKTIIRLLSMWSAVLEVFENIYNDGVCKKQRSQVLDLSDKMGNYEFVFIAHLMKEILGLTAELSFFLQQRDKNIVGAVALIETTKTRFQQLRDAGWNNLVEEVNSFCNINGISIINMEDKVSCRLRSQNAPTYYHYYHVEIFCQVIDRLMEEMNNRFTEANTELLMCISCLDPRNSFSKFSYSRLIRLAELYPKDFSSSDIMELKNQLKTYIINMQQNEDFANLEGIGALSKKMVELDFHRAFHLVYRLIELLLVLPVATASVKRAFSAMEIIKTDLHNKMGDEYLNDCMVCYLEKEIFLKIENEVVMTIFKT